MTIRRERPSTDPRRLVDEHGNKIDETDRGLVYDLQTLVDRRKVLGLFGGLSEAALLAACGGSGGGGGSDAGGTTATSTTGGGSAAGGDLSEVPEETAGPFPADGSNGPNVLDDSGIVRSDIRSSFGASTTTAEGVPLTIKLTVRDAASGDAARGPGVPVALQPRRQLLPLQPGRRRRELPARRPGGRRRRHRHLPVDLPGLLLGPLAPRHFEVYATLSDATSSGPIVKTSQIALPKEACEAVYATSGYEQSVANLSQVSLAGDNVFGDDGGIHQIATMSGDASSGYTAALTIGV